MKKIISWNVNGLKRVMNTGFSEFIEKENPDIICLQETHATEDGVARLTQSLRGYRLVSSSAVKNGSYYNCGVATLSRQKPESVSKKFQTSRFDDKGRVLISDFSGFTLLNCYFPTGTTALKLEEKRAFYQECYATLKRIVDEDKSVILCGDFNTAREERDVANAAKKKKTAGFLPADHEDIEKLFSLGLIDAFRIKNKEQGHYTWWHNFPGLKEQNLGWRIDYFLVSPAMKNKISTCYHNPEIVTVDHCPIVLEMI